MGFEFTIISDETFIRPPYSATGWFILFILGALIGLTLYSWRGYHPRPLKQWGKNQFILFGILLLATPLCSLFLGIHIYPGAEYPPPGGIVDTVDRQIMIFSAVPWMLAGGFLGPLPAAILGMLSGLLRALFETHNPFTPFVIAILAILFSVAVCQRYRTPIFHYLRKPAIAAVMLAFIYPLFYLATTPFSVNGSILTLLDYALNNLLSTWLVASFELLLGGFAAQLVHLLLPALWGSKAPLQPSPAERSLQARFLYSMAPIGILFVIALMIGCWIVAGAVARDLLKNQMATTVKTVASQLPYYFQTGHTMINQLAGDERLYTTAPSQLSALLEKMIKPGTFFSQLVVLDDSGQLLSAYPDGQYTGGQMPIEERAGIQFALSGFSNPSFTIPPVKNSQTAQTSFMSPVTDENQIVRRILIGRVNMEKNPLITSLITSLNEIDEFEGQGMILNENNQVVVHQNPEMILTTYPGRTTDQEPFYTEPALDGVPQLVYFQKIDGGEWAVVMNIPVEIAQRLSLRIAAPLLGIIAILAFLAVIVLNLGLRVVTNSLESLANEAESIAEGNLDQPFPVNGEDEIGKLRQGFEKMRVSLKSRLDELNRLLKVSQGVAANLEIEQAIQPVLDSALAMGAVLSRVVLTPSVIPELDGNSAEPASFSAGSARNLYDSLDEQIFELTRQRERIILTNINRPRLLTLTPGTPHPASLIAFALRHENQFFGAMWVAYDQHHTFSEDEVRFLTMLASQAPRQSFLEGPSTVFCVAV